VLRRVGLWEVSMQATGPQSLLCCAVSRAVELTLPLVYALQGVHPACEA
jgi:hypothetical protein